MDKNEIEALSNYRLEQAKENLEEAIALANIKKYKGASNRGLLCNFSCNKSNFSIGRNWF